MGASQEEIIGRNKWYRLGELLTRLVKEKPLGTLGGIIVLVFLTVGIFADLIAPYGYNEFDLSARLSPPSSEHILGGDSLGRDLLSRIVYGARISLYVGLAAAGLTASAATIIGTISGFYGGKTDAIIQRFVDAFMCFPAMFLYLTLMAVVGPGIGQVIMVLGTIEGVRQSRVVRSAVIGIKGLQYVEAAKAIGANPIIILTRHILPNILAPIIIIFTVFTAHMIIREATLSFLGFGVPPPIPTWGGMLSQGGRHYMIKAPWLAVWPGLALAVVVYGINMLGDAMRDILDPRLRGNAGRYGGTKAKKRIK
ncbi:ABC transporter permease [Chloroflexota bacterium]